MQDDPPGLPPSDWRTILERASADLAAGRGVPAVEVHRRLRRTIAELEARAAAGQPPEIARQS